MPPTRPRSHELETESRNFVKQSLPSSWIIEDVSPDYGSDLRVEIVEDETPTGLIFIVQLKAHEKITYTDNSLSEDLSVDHVLYYQRLVLPIFLVTYDAERKSAYYLDIKGFVDNVLSPRNPYWAYQTSVRVHIKTTNQVASSTQDITSTVKQFFRNHGLLRQQKHRSLVNLVSGIALAELSKIFPKRKAFYSTYSRTLSRFKRRRLPSNLFSLVRSSLEPYVIFEEVNRETLVKLKVAESNLISKGATMLEDQDLIELLDSPWAKSTNPFVRGFILSIRIKSNPKFINQVNLHRFYDLDLFFALVEQLQVMAPSLTRKIRGVQLDVLAQATEDKVFTRTIVRFSNPDIRRRYEDFCNRRFSRPDKEVVVTSEYCALVALASQVSPPFESKTIMKESPGRSFGISFLEGVKSDKATLLDILSIQKVTSHRPFITVVSTATDLHFYGANVGFVSLSAGQKLSIRNLQGDPTISAHGEGGMIYYVDGVPAMEFRVGVINVLSHLPTELVQSINSTQGKRPILHTVVLASRSNLPKDEKEIASKQIIDKLRERYPNLTIAGKLDPSNIAPDI